MASDTPFYNLHDLTIVFILFSAENGVIRFCAAQCLSNIARFDGFLRPVLQAAVAPLHQKLRTGEISTHVRCGLVELLFILSELNIEVIFNCIIYCGMFLCVHMFMLGNVFKNSLKFRCWEVFDC